MSALSFIRDLAIYAVILLSLLSFLSKYQCREGLAWMGEQDNGGEHGYTEASKTTLVSKTTAASTATRR